MSARSDEKQFYRSKSFKKSLSTSEIPLLVTPPTPRQGISTVKGLEDIIILKDTQAQERTKMLQPRDRRSTSTLYQYDTSVTMRQIIKSWIQFHGEILLGTCLNFVFRTQPQHRRGDLLKPWQAAMFFTCIVMLLATIVFFLMSFWKFMQLR